MLGQGSTGIGFIPHVINVNAGEDVSSKIMAFSQNGPRAVCILSANGAVSNVTLRQAATSGGTATYEVIVGSFIADGRKEPKSANYMEPLSAPPKVNLGSATGASSSPSRGTFSESSGGPASPLNLSSGACNNHHPPGMSGMPWK
ncbi:UNVERIFIED_CONTAM: AT-hook motif nuclear-localized protein 10 [Sesamum radiatum]|uniref:AT-hook motif nuclear-localized protein n=1 Tax=Sesamum radiatum TaxID=300843 RepID=A0AAW2QF90_SESRA